MKSNEYFVLDNSYEPGMRGIINGFKYLILAMFYRISMSLINNKPSEKRYNVSICAIFKNEAKYLKEWIEYHRIVGIDHFYLYNNNSEDYYFEVLNPYINSGIVTLVDWPQNHKQMECYMDCIKKRKDESKWIGFIDIDEFVVPKSTHNVYDFLAKYEKNCGSVNIYWKVFGTSGKVKRDEKGLVVEDFTVCWPKYDDIGKCFYNTAFDFDFESRHTKQLHHRLWTKWRSIELPPVNIFNRICVGTRHIALNRDFPIQINHYFTKTYKEYCEKRSKGDAYFKINVHDEEYFYKHEMLCCSSDYSAYKYLIKLKHAMSDYDYLHNIQ